MSHTHTQIHADDHFDIGVYDVKCLITSALEERGPFGDGLSHLCCLFSREGELWLLEDSAMLLALCVNTIETNVSEKSCSNPCMFF